ncbi:MAG: hypothetical protein V1754_00800, partial [Pseudomonadota bacterium]
KLQQMAKSSVASGVLQCVTGVASAALTFCQANSSGDFSANAGAAAKAIDGLGRVDPFSMRNNFQTVEKQNLETDVKTADNRAQDAGDRLSEAKRMSISYAKRLESLLQTQHEKAMSALKG